MRRLIAAASAAALLLWPLAAASRPQAESAEHFVHRLMAVYAAMDRWPAHGDPSKRFYDAGLLSLMNRTEALFAKQGDALLDYDPVCQCNGGPPDNRVTGVRATGDGRAEANLRRVDDGKPIEWTLILRKHAGAWKVYDVIEPDLGGLRARLSKAEADCRRARTAHKDC
jgi:hypothetical protein